MALKFLRKKSQYASKLERVLGFYPKNITLYQQAFRHKSELIKTNSPKHESNERLEFLGDAILSSVTSALVFKKFPYKDEGYLTQMRIKLINRNFLNNLGQKIGLDEFVGESISRDSKSALGNALEALIGAIYIDKGYNKAEKFVLTRLFEPHIVIDDVFEAETDYKSRTIEYVQKGKHKLEFETEEVEQFDRKFYKTKLFIDNQLLGVGEANSKKVSEKLACEQFIKNKES